MKNRILFLIAVWPLVGAGLPAESTYKLGQRYTVTIHGTLSIHDWVETVGDVTGEMTAGPHAGGGIDLNIIRPGMSAEDKDRVRQEIARVASLTLRGW